MDEAEAAERREDPRPAQTRELVLQAARLIVASEGQAAVTPTRLVELSGVARSTIYRHWPDAGSIIVDAMEADRERERTPQASGDPGEDLRTYLQQLRDVLEGGGGAIIVAQADIAERDEKAAQTLAATGHDRSQIVHDFLDDPRDDFTTTHVQLVGPLFMQRFFMREPISDELIDEIVSSYLAGRTRQ